MSAAKDLDRMSPPELKEAWGAADDSGDLARRKAVSAEILSRTFLGADALTRRARVDFPDHRETDADRAAGWMQRAETHLNRTAANTRPTLTLVSDNTKDPA